MSGTERLNAALEGRYRIEKQLGQGGMATVYLAQDVKHDRKVAVKVLKPELAAVLGAERFVVEIKTTASLQHPHILPLFDSGTADGFLFYVMPYIEGETLRDRLTRESQLGVDEAIKITTEVADALDYAHRHGVIHRDIKPENILLHDGRPMVADFGIALAVSAAAGGRMTETGLSLGTPHYMSPEQATADKDITARSDIYSLASVLYEMLAGVPPHSGGSAQQIIMRIITDAARPVTELRKSAPPHVAAALAKALEKVPADRFATAKAFADALMNQAFTSATGAGVPVSGLRSPVSSLPFVVASSVAVLAISGFLWALQRKPIVDEQPVVRVAVDLPPGETLFPAQLSTVAISPQGDRLAYVTQKGSSVHLVSRRTGELTVRELTNNAVNSPTFSPDGNWVAYQDGQQILKVPADGGPSIGLATMPLQIRGLTWAKSDTIIFGSDAGMFAVSAKGGTPRRVPGVDSTQPSMFGALTSSGKSIAYVVGGGMRKLVVTSLATGRTTRFESSAAMVLGMRDGHLLYTTGTGELFAVPFDEENQRLTGDPVQIDNNIRLSPATSALASLSETGSLLYVTGTFSGRLVRVTPGRTDALVWSEERSFRYPRLSPNGKKIAVQVAATRGSNIWTLDLEGGTFTPLTTDAADAAFAPEWSPDGARITYRSNRGGQQSVWWQPADGSGAAELLYHPPELINEALLAPGGKWLVYRTTPGVHSRDIFAVQLEGERKPIALVTGPAQESHARVSPDGKWMAYHTNETGQFEVFVRPFPGPGPRIPITNRGGSEPIWSRSGNAIYYRTLSSGVEVASVSIGPPFSVRARREMLPASDYMADGSHTSWDVFPDGNSFLMIKPVGSDSRPILVHNWGRELRQKLAAERR